MIPLFTLSVSHLAMQGKTRTEYAEAFVSRFKATCIVITSRSNVTSPFSRL
jgi:hypothetical protein